MQKYVAEHKFREDLYYRINVIDITLPPLRERPDDIPILCDHLLSKINSKYKSFGVLDPETVRAFQRYSWPGNIRELEHILERLVLTVDNDIISTKYLPANIKKELGDLITEDTASRKVEMDAEKKGLSYKEIEIEKICALYKELKSSYKVAKELNISQSKATRIVNKYLKNKE